MSKGNRGLQNVTSNVLEKMAEVHGNRTHLPSYSPDTPDLKSEKATSALSTSEVI